MSEALAHKQLWLLGELVAEERALPNPNGRGANPDDLTAQQSAFIDAYLKTLNATKAAVEAGYSARTAQQQGSRLLSNVVVRAELKRRLEIMRAQAQITVAGVAEQLRKLAFSDVRTLYGADGALLPVHSWPDDMAARVAGLETEETWTVNGLEIGDAARDAIRRVVRDMLGGAEVGEGFELVNVKVTKLKTWNPGDSLKTLAQYLRMLTADPAGLGPNGSIEGEARELTHAELQQEALKIAARAGNAL